MKTASKRRLMSLPSLTKQRAISSQAFDLKALEVSAQSKIEIQNSKMTKKRPFSKHFKALQRKICTTPIRHSDILAIHIFAGFYVPSPQKALKFNFITLSYTFFLCPNCNSADKRQTNPSIVRLVAPSCTQLHQNISEVWAFAPQSIHGKLPFMIEKGSTPEIIHKS
jgi:hypothetical protein